MRKSQNIIIIIGVVLALLSIKYGYFHFGECNLKDPDQENTRLRAWTENPSDQTNVFLSSSENQIAVAKITMSDRVDTLKKKSPPLKISSSKASGSASSSLQRKPSDISPDPPSRRGN